MRNRVRVSVIVVFIFTLVMVGVVIPMTIEITDSTIIMGVKYLESDQTTHFLLGHQITTPLDSTGYPLYHVYKSQTGVWSLPIRLNFNLGDYVAFESNNDSIRIYTTKDFFYRFPTEPPSEKEIVRRGKILYEHVFDPLKGEWISQSIFDTDHVAGLPNDGSSAAVIRGVDLIDGNVLFVEWSEYFAQTGYLTKIGSDPDSQQTYEIQNRIIEAITPRKNHTGHYFIYTRNSDISYNFSRLTLFPNNTMTGPAYISINYQDVIYDIKDNFLLRIADRNSSPSWEIYDLSISGIPVTTYPYTHKTYAIFFPDIIYPFDLVKWGDSLVFATVLDADIDFWVFDISQGNLQHLGNTTQDFYDAEYGDLQSIDVINEGESLALYWTTRAVAPHRYQVFTTSFDKTNASVTDITALSPQLDFTTEETQLFLGVWVFEGVVSVLIIFMAWALIKGSTK